MGTTDLTAAVLPPVVKAVYNTVWYLIDTGCFLGELDHVAINILQKRGLFIPLFIFNNNIGRIFNETAGSLDSSQQYTSDKLEVTEHISTVSIFLL